MATKKFDDVIKDQILSHLVELLPQRIDWLLPKDGEPLAEKARGDFHFSWDLGDSSVVLRKQPDDSFVLIMSVGGDEIKLRGVRVDNLYSKIKELVGDKLAGSTYLAAIDRLRATPIKEKVK